MFSSLNLYPISPNPPFLPPKIQLVLAVTATLGGALLFFGGLGLRRRRERGRLLVLAAIRTGFSYYIFWPIGTAITMYNDKGSLARRFGIVAAAGFGGFIWISILRMALHYFQSTGVRRLCYPLASPNPPVSAD
jgi:hypothetical protein